MLQEPLGIVVFIISLIYWSVAIFKPTKPRIEDEKTEATSEPSNKFGLIVVQIGFLIVLTFGSALGLFAILQNFGRAPGRSILLLVGITFLGWLLLARPERFAVILIGGIIVMGSSGLLGRCSTNGSDTFEYRPPRSL